MTAVSLVARNVVLERGPDASRSSSAVLSIAQVATVYCDNNGVAAVGGTDTITINLASAIQSSKRNGKTVTIRALAVSQPLTTQTSAGVEATHSGYATLGSGTTMTIVPKSDGWLTGDTSSTISATAPVVTPYGITCVYTEA
jgi:endonuclease YncB( thermonuclease family)